MVTTLTVQNQVTDSWTFSTSAPLTMENVSGIIDWGDGTISDYTYSPASHSYSSGGTYTIKFTTDYFENTCGGFCANNQYVINVTFGEGIIHIMGGTFYGASKLQSANLPSSAIVDEQSFTNCVSLTKVVFGNSNKFCNNSIYTQNQNAFLGCTSLSKIIYFNGGNETISDYFMIGENSYVSVYYTSDGKIDDGDIDHSGEIRLMRIGSHMPSFRHINVERSSKVIWKIALGSRIIWQLGNKKPVEDKYISKIYVFKTPNIYKYQIGETYDFTGLIVKAVWTDGTETDITEEIKDQLPVGEVTYTGLSSGTYNCKKYVYIEYNTTAGIKKTGLTLTINPYYFDINCVFKDGAILTPTLFFDSDTPTATYWFDVITSTTTQTTNFSNLFSYLYPASLSGRLIRISNCNATNIDKLPFIVNKAKFQNMHIGYYIERIEKNAFSSITDDIYMCIPRTVKFIGEGAFSNIGSHSKVYIYQETKVEDGAFPNNCDITFYERENDIP